MRDSSLRKSVNGEACRSYTKKHGKRGGARRDQGGLPAAIGHHADEGYHREIVKISLPEKGEPRDKRLTRSDAAKQIWTLLTLSRNAKDVPRPTDRQASASTSCPVYFVGCLL